jgi:NitT/TauT family transport system permease protein
MAADAAPTDVRALEARLDALDSAVVATPVNPLRTVWRASWPPATAIVVFVAVWQAVALARVGPSSALPGPSGVWTAFVSAAQDGSAARAAGLSLGRAGLGFAISVAIGVLLGTAMATAPLLRRALGPIVTGLQSLPSVAWVPAAVIWFELSDAAIFTVVLLGTVPSVINGLLAGVDQVPPLFVRVGRALGARGWTRIRYVLLPAALPGFLAGLRQGWAFAWRSLMTAELISSSPQLGTGLGQLLALGRETDNMPLVIASILMIFVIGITIELGVFSPLERRVLHARGLTGSGSG